MTPESLKPLEKHSEPESLRLKMHQPGQLSWSSFLDSGKGMTNTGVFVHNSETRVFKDQE